MATETADGWDDHLRGLTVTTLASVLGIGAGVAAQALAAGPNDRLGLYLLGAAVLVQLPVYMAIGIDVDDFGVKEYLYIAFITFSLWFVSWGILLTAETSL
ncbi:hypothetical protein I7X12_07170 [Halosimplex litoreum]|uniref:Uncharacterized protein n=1 Tax=Halosimplex litoreum TaxID=1198301 RepID=A0A7T3G104_9EURY|nr:hypothetical protein [Halosimplex litoreum]QPV64386.1 hypothetical protein I7X12_07170 [Halosimplex litoreum]